jgi:hypothetical protein
MSWAVVVAADASGEIGEGLELHLVPVNKSAGCLVGLTADGIGGRGQVKAGINAGKAKGGR